MTTFAVQTTIDAPVTAVWQALADIGTIYQWNPGVKASHRTSEQAEGVGACRYCDLGGKNYLEERVVAWEPEKQLTMRITGTNLPFKTADIRFTLTPVGDQTAVTVSPLYQLHYGLAGRLLDRLYVQGNYQKGMTSLLAGLKKYVEEYSE